MLVNLVTVFPTSWAVLLLLLTGGGGVVHAEVGWYAVVKTGKPLQSKHKLPALADLILSPHIRCSLC